MIITLFRQDPALRGLGPALLGGGLAGMLLRSLASTLPASMEALSGTMRGWIFFTTALLVFTSLTLMFQQNFMTRASRMALALPIAARTLWRVRILSILLTSVLPIALVTFITASGASGEVKQMLLLTGLRGCAVLVLAGLLFQYLDSDLHMVRTGPRYLVYVASISCASVIYVSLVPPSWVSTLIPAITAVAAAAFIHARTPLAYLLAPTQLPPLTQVDSCPLTQVDVDSRWILRRTIFSTLINRWLSWMVAGGCAFIALATVLSYGSGENPMPHLFISLLWPVAILDQAVIRLHRIDHLPIPRGRIFAYVVLALLIPMLLGGSLGGLGLLGPDAASHIRYSQRRLHVPPEAWEILGSGPVPTVTAPWGETYTPREHRLYPGSSAIVYMPYESGADSSDRFRALQANRAVRAVHGNALFADDAFTDADDENPILKGLRQERAQGLSFLVPGFAGEPASSRNRLYAVGGGVGILLFTLFWSLSLLGHHPRVARWIARACYFGLFGLVAAYYLAAVIEDLSGFSEALLMLPMILLKRLGRAIPFATPLLWLANLPLALACYFLMRGLFCTIEAPTGKVKPVWKEYG